MARVSEDGALPRHRPRSSGLCWYPVGLAYKSPACASQHNAPTDVSCSRCSSRRVGGCEMSEERLKDSAEWECLCVPSLEALCDSSFLRCAREWRKSFSVCSTSVTWLILPVVICLSQRLSHACLSISFYTAKLRMAH